MATANLTLDSMTIYPAADIKDVYLFHHAGELVATIIEWSDAVEVRVTRMLTGAEHDCAMAFVGGLANRDCTVINYEPNGQLIADAGGCEIAKAPRPAFVPQAPAPAIAAQLEPIAVPVAADRPRMILLAQDHDCQCGDSEDDPCPACQAAIRAADMAARDRSAAVEFAFYAGMEDF